MKTGTKEWRLKTKEWSEWKLKDKMSYKDTVDWADTVALNKQNVLKKSKQFTFGKCAKYAQPSHWANEKDLLNYHALK